MTRLAAIELTKWRSFERKQRVELRPLTMFFGWNNSGKSALLRALPIVADSMRPDAITPLNLAGLAARGATFRDVSWRGARKGLSVSLEWEGEPTPRYAVDLALDDTEGTMPRMYVERFSWSNEHGDTLLGTWVPAEPAGADLEYQLTGAGAGRALVGFVGLRPSFRAEVHNGGIAWLKARLAALDRSVQWLASVRSLPFGLVKVPEGVATNYASDGSDAIATLQQLPHVLAEVNVWLREHVQRTLELRQIAPGFVQPELRHVGSAHTQRLADHGEGLLQVLPVLTALASARTGAGALATPRFLAVEDPESHLHPRLQRALASRIAEVVGSASPPTVVLETHSQHLLLGVQLAVANGLPPERIALYWVDQDDEGVSAATRIEIHRNGDLMGWPPGVYDDIVDMAGAVIERSWGSNP